MIDSTERQAIVDAEHLRVLVVGYYVSAGVHALFAFFPLLYVAMGVMMAMTPPRDNSPGPSPRLFGFLFAAIGVAIFLLMLGLAVLQFQAGRSISARRSRVLCLIAAGVSCLLIPYGTLLGIFTFMVLERPSITALFGRSSGAPPHHETPPPPPLPFTGAPGAGAT